MKRGMTLIEIVIACFLLAIVVAVLAPAVFRPSHAAGRRAACQNALKQFGLVFKMYASESKGELYPPVMATAADIVDCEDAEHPTIEKGGFAAPAPQLSSIYPEYLYDAILLRCTENDTYTRPFSEEGLQNPKTLLLPCAQPERGLRLAAQSYFYFGWVFDAASCSDSMLQFGDMVGPRQMTESLSIAFSPWTLREATQRDVARLDEDLKTVTDGLGNNKTGKAIHRLREGVARVLITDTNNPAAAEMAASTVWVMADRPNPTLPPTTEPDGTLYAHIPGGANVLFLDGHVEFQKFGKSATTPRADEPCRAPTNEPVARFLLTAFPAK